MQTRLSIPLVLVLTIIDTLSKNSSFIIGEIARMKAREFVTEINAERFSSPFFRILYAIQSTKLL